MVNLMYKQDPKESPQLRSGQQTFFARPERRARPPVNVQPAAPTNMLSDYWRTISRHRAAIGLCALVGVTLALVLGMGTEPVYRTRTSLNIQNLNGDFMNRRAINPTGGTADDSTEENLQTQIKLLQSETLLDTTTKRLKAEAHPRFIEKSDLFSRLGRKLHLTRGEQVPYDALVDETARQVKVKPLGMTHLVEITCDSWSAAFAAKFCNTLVTEYQAEDIATRGEETRRTSDWLNTQVADLRTKVEESQRRLEDATGGNGLVLSQESTTVGEDRLRQLQNELIRAQADRMQKEAESRTALSAPSDTVPTVLDNANYRSYQAKLADLNAQVAALVPPLTEANPKVMHLRAEIKAVEDGMSQATSTSKVRMVNELSAAKQRERLLAATYDAQEANVSSSLKKMSRIALLRKEVESEQTIYETLLQRSKEAGLASAMQTSTAHVVDEARVPQVPFSPQKGKDAATGMVLGSLVGLGFAFYKDRHAKLFREPGDVTRVLQVQELGVIPAAKQPVALAGAALALHGGKPSAPRVINPVATARWEDQFSIVAEAYRNATYSLLTTADTVVRAKMYVVSSPSEGEGKTTVVSNLGVALSKAKLRVVLIDGDLRRPNLHKALSVENDFGVRDILRSNQLLDIATTEQLCKRTRFANLQVIPAGTGNEDVVELLHSHRVGALLARLSRDFDVILIDTPPMLHMADARIFAGKTKEAILVVRSGTTGHQQAVAARDLLDQDGVRIVGSILNDFDADREGLSDYYKSYYRYVTPSSDRDVKSA